MSTPTTFDATGEWAAELAELQLRRRQAQAMGGPEACDPAVIEINEAPGLVR